MANNYRAAKVLLELLQITFNYSAYVDYYYIMIDQSNNYFD